MVKDYEWWFVILILCCPVLIAGCSSPASSEADRLNARAYSFHYRNLDSTEACAQRAYELSDGHTASRAEALNNMAFVNIVRMQYDKAKQLLDRIETITDNQIELLVANVQQMRLCQRMSRNREFYDYRESALRILRRINEERASLTDRQQLRLAYAESELSIVTSTYFYYVGLERQSALALKEVRHDVEKDTAQYLSYLYNVGSGGFFTSGTQEEINQIEFDHLMRCFLLAKQAGYPYFAANSLEALAEHLTDANYRAKLIADNLPAMKFVNTAGVTDDVLPLFLASNALEIFREYGDAYQIAGAYRTLASCYLAQGEYEAALHNLEMALSDPIILQAPDLVASIREQMSVAYAAIDDKAKSDENRNIYLDLQEQTRQDRSLEARAGQLDNTVAQLNQLLLAVVIVIVLVLFLLWLFNYLNRKGRREDQLDALLEPLRDWELRNEKNINALKEWEEELDEQLALGRLRVENGERRNLEQRAKVSLVNSIMPFIDRMLHEVTRLDEQNRDERLEYIRELTDKINEQNDVLTHWIQLRQGELSLHIETFPLQELFETVSKGRMSFRLKGITLDVVATTARVKADKVLTLFMLNTLADNARKFTPEGGRVVVQASETSDFVEISVTDTGIGMDEEQLAHVFEHKISGGHGFGLLNCKGIIEKYRKLSKIFAVCLLSAESRQGEGSRFFFRLPRGLAKMLLGLMAGTALLGQATSVAAADGPRQHALAQASVYADSAYFSNINGRYERTLLFADSCRRCMNAHFRSLRPASADTLLRMGDPSLTPPEILWLHDSIDVNYNVLLDIRNESAVAALALHQWQLYNYNNRIYTQLFKELSADSTLDDYCRTMQQSQTNKQIAVILLLVLLIAILPAYYLLYARHRMYYRFCVEQIKSINALLLSSISDAEKLNRIAQMGTGRFPEPLKHIVSEIEVALTESLKLRDMREESIQMKQDDLQKSHLEEDHLHVSNSVLDNCLSTLKHETMYYPSRIRQLIDAGQMDSLPEVAAYYRELYSILSQQAMHQLEHSMLHLRALEHDILGDETLINYLYDILKRQSGQRQLSMTAIARDERYVELRVPMPQLVLTDDQLAQLFTPATDHIPYLLCRQIVRDHGEATNRRGCGIWAERNQQATTIVIILPRVWKDSKSSS